MNSSNIFSKNIILMYVQEFLLIFLATLLEMRFRHKVLQEFLQSFHLEFPQEIRRGNQEFLLKSRPEIIPNVPPQFCLQENPRSFFLELVQQIFQVLHRILIQTFKKKIKFSKIQPIFKIWIEIFQLWTKFKK